MGMFHKNISEEKRASLELAEASREEAWVHPSFLVELFQGRVRWDLVSPFPKQNPHDKKEGDDFLVKLEEFLKKNINAEEIDRTGEISSDAIKGLFDLGAFAIKIPKDYGGLGFSQVNYNRAIHLVASHCGSTA
ncbi:acyl-CoA dehydrogenase family protein, partial [PVC group bacterium]|nr:acyl-CoA dehydrogenase family protein [PVC group bacterium]